MFNKLDELDKLEKLDELDKLEKLDELDNVNRYIILIVNVKIKNRDKY